jgi:hypothetical protein
LPLCGAELPLCLAYSFSFPLFFAFLLLPLPPSLITIHELVTKTKEQCDDFFLPIFKVLILVCAGDSVPVIIDQL